MFTYVHMEDKATLAAVPQMPCSMVLGLVLMKQAILAN